MHRRGFIVIFGGLLLGALPNLAAAQTAIPVGAATIQVAAAAPDGSAMAVWTYRPAALKPDDRILFVMHGVLRNADRYRDDWIAAAEANRFLLVVPEMSQRQFPKDPGYNFGNMVDTAGTAQPADTWAWRSIETVFDAVRSGTGSSRTTYAIYGHSAGAQFVHRMAMFADNPRFDAAIAANAGWYTLPVFDETFPYGLAKAPIDEARMKANFAKPMLILLGEADIDPNHRVLRRDAASDRQGTFRLARGQNFMRVATEQAQRLGVPIAWKLETVPGVAHDSAGMTDAAVTWLFKR
jgi:poly(3-hydroxybutyrate) depolymerase